MNIEIQISSSDLRMNWYNMRTMFGYNMLYAIRHQRKENEKMSSNQDFVEYIVEQMENTGIITYKKMFGEYAIYYDSKIVALICDNQLFVKKTQGGKAFIGDVKEAPPYPGAKMSFLIDDRIDDREWMSELIRITASELPVTKPKKKKLKGEN